jgi:hypothetical protein
MGKIDFTIEDLGALIENNMNTLKGVEKFEYDSDNLVLLQSNELNNKLIRKVSRYKRKKYLVTHGTTGSTPESMVIKSLLDLVEIFPIEPETKKTLKKKYK